MEKCPCGSGKAYNKCCLPLIKGEKAAQTAEELMRSRYTAYVKQEIDYIYDTTHPGHRDDFDRDATLDWAKNSEWLGIEIRNTSKGTAQDEEGEVEFIASFAQKGVKKDHHELSTFKKEEGRWYFEDGKGVSIKPYVRVEDKTGRNDPCPCGSGKKYKKCCGQAA
ncbi:MAG: YchJ family protein [Syntrophomonadaceae bacterium]